MPFTATIQSSIKTDDGCTTASSLQVSALTAKSSFDEIIPAGTFDFAPYLANFPAQIQGILIIAFDAGFTVSVDGSNFSTRKYKQFLVQVADTGVQALKIVLAVASRVQFIAVGS